MATASVRPAPDFLLVGAKRGGTTSAYFHILSHPQVLPLFPSARLIPKGRNTKGTHYFASEFDRGPIWYASHFPTRFRRAMARRSSGRTVVAGEASPYYLFHPSAAARAFAAVPDAKILIALRDPVERTYSAYREQVRNGVETLPFQAALDAEAARVRGEEQRLRDDPDYYSFAHEFQSYAAQSEYAASLGRWFASFPREQIHVWASEDYYADADATVRQICDFLGLSVQGLPTIEPLNAAPQASLDAGLRSELVDRFRGDVALTEKLLGRSMPWPNFALA
ncbi:MAG: sulfotransferase [Humibacillus sp.]|nr:sulfotransferase [Humibacillus sp.]